MKEAEDSFLSKKLDQLKISDLASSTDSSWVILTGSPPWVGREADALADGTVNSCQNLKQYERGKSKGFVPCERGHFVV